MSSQPAHVSMSTCTLLHIIQRTYKKEVKCCGDSDILHEIFRDTPRKAEKLIRVVSQTSLCSISDSLPATLNFLTNSVTDKFQQTYGIIHIYRK